MACHERLGAKVDDVVDNIAEGESPRAHLRFLDPEEPFQAVERANRFYIDPAGYERYNLVADIIESLDTAGSVELYRNIKPLIDEAYRELGRVDGSFDETLSLAMEQLLETPVPRIESAHCAVPKLSLRRSRPGIPLPRSEALLPHGPA